MKTLNSYWFGIFVFLFLLSQSAYSLTSPSVRDGPVVVSLISEVSQVQKNENFYIGLKFLLQKGWHVYWKNPGDSGMPPRVHWEGEVHTGEFDWPSPNRFFIDPLENYGYEERIVFPMIVSAVENQSQALHLKGHFEWLMCQTECVPGRATLELVIPIGGSTQESPENSREIQYFLERTPQKIHNLSPTFFHDPQEQNLSLQFSFQKNIGGAYFYPEDQDRIHHAASQKLTLLSDGQYELVIPQSENALNYISSLPGVLEILSDSGTKEYFQIQPKLIPKKQNPKEFLFVWVFAFLGGLLLNLMPCVFPVIFIKVLSLIEVTRERPAMIRLHGWAYTAGVLVSFLVLSGLLLLFQSLGKSMGWGFQLQSPIFVLFLSLLFFILSLNLYGYFELSGRFTNFGGQWAQKKNLMGSFFTGILAVVVATPCTAPFMGTALGVTLSMPPLSATLVYMGLGGGLAFPYLALCYFPALLKKLPRPGSWMEKLKQFLSLPLLLTTLWLIWVLGRQTSLETALIVLAFFTLIFFGFWLDRNWNLQNIQVKRLALIIIFLLGLGYVYQDIQIKEKGIRSVVLEPDWEPFHTQNIEKYISEKTPFFVDFTAAWCITCQVNKKLVLRTEKIKRLFKDQNIKLIVADWTNQDPEITQYLQRLGRNSVPLYMYYDSHGKRTILPEILTQEILEKVIGTEEL